MHPQSGARRFKKRFHRQIRFCCLALVLSACSTPVPQPPQSDEAYRDHGPESQPDLPRSLRISAVGDIMLGGSAAPEMEKFGFRYPFERVSNFFRDSHIVFGNLEGPLTDIGQAEPNKEYVFRSPPDKVAPALAAAGFNVMSLANNHTMDYGVDGLKQTLTALAGVGIHAAGAGMNEFEARRPTVINAAGQRIMLLAYSLTFPQSYWAERDKPGTAFGHEANVRADVIAARARADVVIVSFHWGREITTALRDYQPKLAHVAIDAGASAVIGHHPHILQGVEQYKHGVILYSLGNFTFGSYSKRATRSAIAQIELVEGRFRRLKMIPINVNNVEVVFQPRLLTGNAAREVVAELQRLSAPLNTLIEEINGNAVLIASPTDSGPTPGHRQQLPLSTGP